MNGSPHLPASMRQWYGDSRGHWEGDTLVIDVTNLIMANISGRNHQFDVPKAGPARRWRRVPR
jgi:hypothetical protein